MKIQKLIYLLLFFIFIESCKTKTDIVVPDTELIVIVKDDSSRVLKGARVALFDNILAYQNAVALNNTSGSVSVDSTDIDGKAFFPRLSEDKIYYLYITYRSYSRSLDFSNNSSQFVLKNTLAKSSKTQVEISLEASNSNISFWTRGANFSNLDLVIYLDADTIGTLQDTLQTAPSNAFQSGTVTVNKNPGVYRWRTSGQNGCFWGDTILVKKGEFKKIEIPSECNNGTISFFTGPNNSASLPLTIVLDQNDTVGILNTTRINAPLNCNESGTLVVKRPEGEHSFHVISSSGSCVWTGKINLIKDDCVIQKLTDCR